MDIIKYLDFSILFAVLSRLRLNTHGVRRYLVIETCRPHVSITKYAPLRPAMCSPSGLRAYAGHVFIHRIFDGHLLGIGWSFLCRSGDIGIDKISIW